MSKTDCEFINFYANLLWWKENGGRSMVERGPPRFKLRRSFLFWGHKRLLTRGHKRPRL